MNQKATIVGRASRVHDSQGDRVEFKIDRGLRGGKLDTVSLTPAETLNLAHDLIKALVSMWGRERADLG